MEHIHYKIPLPHVNRWIATWLLQKLEEDLKTMDAATTTRKRMKAIEEARFTVPPASITILILPLQPPYENSLLIERFDLSYLLRLKHYTPKLSINFLTTTSKCPYTGVEGPVSVVSNMMALDLNCVVNCQSAEWRSWMRKKWVDGVFVSAKGSYPLCKTCLHLVVTSNYLRTWGLYNISNELNVWFGNEVGRGKDIQLLQPHIGE